MGYKEHTKREFKLAGYEELKEPKSKILVGIIKYLRSFIRFLENKNRPTYRDDNPNIWIQENVYELLAVFANQGHSGSSAPFCIDIFSKLAAFKVLAPLTGEDDEWLEVSPGMYQNIRLSSIFKASDMFNGQAYDINGKVFWEWVERDLDNDEVGYPGRVRDKCYYTCKDSLVPIAFPYTPPETPIYEYRDSNYEEKEI